MQSQLGASVPDLSRAVLDCFLAYRSSGLQSLGYEIDFV